MGKSRQSNLDAITSDSVFEPDSAPSPTFDEEISEVDEEILQRFIKKMEVMCSKVDRFEESYRDTLEYCCEQIATEVGGLADTLEDTKTGRESVNEITVWVENQELSPYTKESLLTSLRVFGHLMLPYTPDDEFDDGELPKRFAEIDPGKHTRGLDPTPLPSEIITYEEAVEMAKHKDHPRDQALIIMAWATGLRPMCELHRLRYKHVEDHGDHYKITVPEDAKTGSRTVCLYTGAALLRRWLEKEHPAHLETEEDLHSETHIWTHQNENKPIVYDTLSDVFDRAGENAGIRKPTPPQNFRRSCASFCAAQSESDEEQLRVRFGWERFSTAPYHYIAKFGEEQMKKTAKVYGYDIKGDREENVSEVHCEQCGQLTTRGFGNCIWCSHNIDPEQQTIPTEVTHPEGHDKDLSTRVIDGEVSVDELKALRKMEPHIKGEEEIFDRLDDMIRLAEGMESDEKTASYVSVFAFVGGGIKQLASWLREKHDSMAISSEFAHYPMQGRRLATFAVVMAVYFIGILGFMSLNGSLARLQAGNPVEISGLVIGLTIGMVMVHREMPSYEDAAADLEE